MNIDFDGAVLLGALTPHPALLIPEIGQDAMGAVNNTVRAMERWAAAVRALKPDVVVIISPHGPLLADAIGIWAVESLVGDFGRFGAPHIRMQYHNDLELVDAVLAQGQSRGYPLAGLDGHGARSRGLSPQLDYATLVPLYYLEQAGVDAPLLAMGMGLMPPARLYEFGDLLRQALAKADRRAVVIASGDLSHRLTPDAPAGYSPQGRIFDQTLWQLLGAGDVQGLLRMDERLVEAAGECGYRALVMLLGCWQGQQLATLPLSYEGPYGVGYGVCVLHSPGRELPDCLAGFPLVELARETVEVLAKGGRAPDPRQLMLPPGYPARAGVFVTIKKGGELRGCIGTVSPTQPSLAEEIIYAARQASTTDPRFGPIQPWELPELCYSIDVLGPPEPISHVAELDPKRYGVIVEAGLRKGLLLPDLRGVDSGSKQVAIAREKAGIGPHEPVQLLRFAVRRLQ